MVWRRLVDQDEHNPDLLAAALLHDVGKSRFPLRLWERVLIVSLKAFFPDRATRWGVGAAKGWRRALVVAAQHPTWGAEMARQAMQHLDFFEDKADLLRAVAGFVVSRRH